MPANAREEGGRSRHLAGAKLPRGLARLSRVRVVLDLRISVLRLSTRFAQDPRREGQSPLRLSSSEALALKLLALPAARRALVGRIWVWLRAVDPTVARQRANIDVDELGARVPADAHSPRVEGAGKITDLLGGHPLDPDI